MSIEREIPLETIRAFVSASSEVVRSITQRGLLNKWLHLYDQRKSVPRFDEYQPDLPADEVKDIICYSITYADGHPHVTIDSFGARMSKAYGTSGVGRELRDYVGPKLAPLILPNYYQCIARRLPVYTISKVEDVHGRSVDFERLLLPFMDGIVVNRIIAWVETISEEGRFEIRNLMHAADALRTDELRAVIDQNLFYHPPGRIPSKDVIEFG